jgi:hypothetical protein
MSQHLWQLVSYRQLRRKRSLLNYISPWCMFILLMFVICRINVANNHTVLSTLSLVGPDDPSFKKVLSAIQRIYDFFDESFAEGVLCPYVAHVVGELDGVLAQTQFISPVKHNAFPAALIPDTYDPNNVLADLVAGGKFVFTEDNIISFFEITSDSDEYAAISLVTCTVLIYCYMVASCRKLLLDLVFSDVVIWLKLDCVFGLSLLAQVKYFLHASIQLC